MIYKKNGITVFLNFIANVINLFWLYIALNCFKKQIECRSKNLNYGYNFG